MSARAIEVLRPGALTSVQDLGRAGFEAAGVPRGGAFDPWAARAANRLVGNADGAALLELTLAGPALRCATSAAIALVGDAFDLALDGAPAPRGVSVEVAAGALVEIGRARAGARAWLAVAGGIEVPLVLGSRSTELASGFGGFEGRALRAGDLLPLGAPAAPFAPRRLAPDAPAADPGARAAAALRIVPGPDARLLGERGVEALAARSFRVDPRSDRRGVRLAGEPLALAPHPPLRSVPMLPGAVEVTPDGLPIVLGVDAPVTGGYPWVAQVVAADLGRLAHLAPGAPAGFEPVSWAAAERALAGREAWLAGAIGS